MLNFLLLNISLCESIFLNAINKLLEFLSYKLQTNIKVSFKCYDNSVLKQQRFDSYFLQ